MTTGNVTRNPPPERVQEILSRCRWRGLMVDAGGAPSSHCWPQTCRVGPSRHEPGHIAFRRTDGTVACRPTTGATAAGSPRPCRGHLAEDAAQEAVIAALQQRRPPDSLSAWLAVAARRLAPRTRGSTRSRAAFEGAAGSLAAARRSTPELEHIDLHTILKEAVAGCHNPTEALSSGTDRGAVPHCQAAPVPGVVGAWSSWSPHSSLPLTGPLSDVVLALLSR